MPRGRKSFDNNPSRLNDRALNSAYNSLPLAPTTVHIDYNDPLSHSYSRPGLIQLDNGGDSASFSSASHLYQANKVVAYDRPDLVPKVMTHRNPYRAADPGPVKGHQVAKWKGQELDTAYKANQLKFNQNPDLAQRLLDTGNSAIRCPPDGAWSDRNGKMLTLIREDIRQQREGVNNWK